MAGVIEALKRPANPTWVMARIAALLSPYYEKSVPAGVRDMEAEDWAEALADYPQWAIQKAVRWWKSEGNPDRRKRPLEGDIAARCRKEMDAVFAAEINLRREADHKPEPKRERISPERANEILAEAGYAVKRMPE